MHNAHRSNHLFKSQPLIWSLSLFALFFSLGMRRRLHIEVCSLALTHTCSMHAPHREPPWLVSSDTEHKVNSVFSSEQQQQQQQQSPEEALSYCFLSFSLLKPLLSTEMNSRHDRGFLCRRQSKAGYLSSAQDVFFFFPLLLLFWKNSLLSQKQTSSPIKHKICNDDRHFIEITISCWRFYVLICCPSRDSLKLWTINTQTWVPWKCTQQLTSVPSW